MHPDDTIVAISSVAAPSARVIVRTSGAAAVEQLQLLLSLAVPDATGVAFRSTLHFDGVVCPTWIYLFRAPASYTGENLVEYHLPGSLVLAEMLLRHLQSSGLRQAEGGEFTARAYLNGRMDLTQAEGVAAMVSAQSEQQMRAGRRLMSGELARRLAGPADQMLSTLALLEVGIDFSDEDVTFLSPTELQSQIAGSRDALQALLNDSERFKPLGHEPTFVLVGRPNAGKSTLLNLLAGNERAVASPMAGTTRDALVADIALQNGFVRLVDVPGLEDAGQQDASTATTEPHAAHSSIKRQMAERAVAEIAQADFVLLLSATDDPLPPPSIGRTADVCLRTKADLGKARADREQPRAVLSISATTGQGIDALREAMNDLAFGRGGSDSALALNVRHVQAVESAIASLDRANVLAMEQGAAELIAADLRDAVAELSAVIGQVSPDELLGRIFSQFCIGK